jgi:hypothetical protein
VRRLLLLVVVSCGASPSAPTDGAASAITCGPRMRPVAGDGSCTGVGTTDTPDGFVPDGAWGFRAILPAAPCTGATIALLGSEACQAIDDCALPFPPPEATVAVRTVAVPYADRPDVKVFATLSEALASAAPGGTIAIDEGEFATPPVLTQAVNIVGRCAARSSLVGPDFGVRIDMPIKVSFRSVAFTGAPKVALLLNSHSVTTLDRVYVHGAGNGADVGNGSTLTVTRSVFEGPLVASNPNAASNGIQALYNGHIVLTEVELRGYQLSVEAESVGTDISISKSVVHEQRALKAEKEALAQIGVFLGAHVGVVSCHVESSPGRIALVGAARVDGLKDPTSPGNPPGSLTVAGSALLQSVIPREDGSVIDLVGGASLAFDNVSLRHDSFVAISASQGSNARIQNSVIQSAPSTTNARTGFYALSGSKLTLESSAIVGASQFAVVLSGASTATIARSLISGTREVGRDAFGAFMGAAQALSVGPGGQATLNDTAFVANEGTAIFLEGATVEMDRAVLSATHASSFGPFTAAITAVDGIVAIRNSALARNDLALALRRGRTLLRDSSVTDHREAMRLEGLTLVQTNDAVEAPVDTKVVAARTTFARNTVLVSAKSFTGE